MLDDLHFSAATAKRLLGVNDLVPLRERDRAEVAAFIESFVGDPPDLRPGAVGRLEGSLSVGPANEVSGMHDQSPVEGTAQIEEV